MLFYLLANAEAHVLFDVSIIQSPLPMKVCAMLLCCSISNIGLESQLKRTEFPQYDVF